MWNATCTNTYDETCLECVLYYHTESIDTTNNKQQLSAIDEEQDTTSVKKGTPSVKKGRKKDKEQPQESKVLYDRVSRYSCHVVVLFLVYMYCVTCV